MAELQSEIETLYQKFLTRWNARDFAGVAECFSEPAMYVLPAATIPVPDRAAMVALLESLFARLEADGFSHTVIGEVSARSCSGTLAVVDAKDVARLRHDGSAIEVIDGHYIAAKSPDGWRFSVAMACDRGWQDG